MVQTFKRSTSCWNLVDWVEVLSCSVFDVRWLFFFSNYLVSNENNSLFYRGNRNSILCHYLPVSFGEKLRICQGAHTICAGLSYILTFVRLGLNILTCGADGRISAEKEIWIEEFLSDFKLLHSSVQDYYDRKAATLVLEEIKLW